MSHPTAQDTADTLSRFVNGLLSEDIDELARQLVRQHPTLASGMARVFVRFFELAADDQGDERRKALAKLGQAVTDLPSDLRRIPYI